MMNAVMSVYKMSYEI